MEPQVISYQLIKAIIQEYKKLLLCLMGGDINYISFASTSTSKKIYL